MALLSLEREYRKLEQTSRANRDKTQAFDAQTLHQQVAPLVAGADDGHTQFLRLGLGRCGSGFRDRLGRWFCSPGSMDDLPGGQACACDGNRLDKTAAAEAFGFVRRDGRGFVLLFHDDFLTPR